MSLKHEDRPTYARAVWDEFCKLSNQTRDMTCQEFYVLSGWMNKGIPLPVILRAFGEFQGKPRRLGAMEGPVEKAFSYWKRSMCLS